MTARQSGEEPAGRPARRARRRPTRRLNGEGSVYFSAGDGRWRAAFYDTTGKRRTLSRRSRADCTAALRALTTERDRGVLAAAPGTIPTLGQWLTHWLGNIDTYVRPSTLDGYRYALSLVPDRLLTYRLDQLRPEYFEDLYRDLIKRRGLSNTTVRGTHGVLKQALNKAVRYGHLLTNPLTLLRPPPIRHKEIVPLSLEQTQAVLAGCPDATASSRWQIALLLGLRQGEALGLRWADLDLKIGTLSVRQALQCQTGVGLVIVDVKSRAGLRTMFMPGPLIAALKEHRTRQTVRQLAAGPAWTDTALLFTHQLGQPVHPRDDSRQWKQITAAAGLPHFRLHDARHTAATLMFASHIEARTVMEILGHSQIAHTLNIYTHVPTETLANAAVTVTDAVYGNPEPPRPPTELHPATGGQEATGESPSA